MFPELFHIGSYSHTYGVLVALAFLAAMAPWSLRPARRASNSDAVVNLGILCGLAPSLGAKMMMFLMDFPTTRAIRARSSPSPAFRPAAFSTAA